VGLILAIRRNIRGFRRRLATVVGLAVFVFAAEIFAAWHEADLAAHANQTPCKICISVEALAAGNVGSLQIVVAPAPAVVHETPAVVVELARRVTPKLARGPPLAS
jgi:hypothetical protein